MQQEEYTFVTIDDNDSTLFDDAVVIDLDDDSDIMDAIVIDESTDGSDFITLADDTVMLLDADMIDSYSSDISDMDISIII
ncbi:MAG: hypothetical protein LBH04_01380 [Tannerellaceae bacterium]|jgi:hypothetical protein|nr:hypothetical protein [Tannerellaceae bacterium]